ncbi:MAG: DUF3095 family protein [Proteobacteria bacterium]|nr:MAG: DUF3095 family protein [Pseudomonadota bacterium]
MDYSRLTRTDTTAFASESSHIVIADVRGSTAAILDGRFREVNLAGAACVAAIRNVYSPEAVPYVFGGDGATFLVEDSELEKCLSILRGVQGIVRDTLFLRLTVGHMSIKEIRERGGEVRYGFVHWAQKDSLPYFRGDGIALAEQEIKRRDDDDRGPIDSNVLNANVEGLSCKHLPFESTRGRVLSLVVQPFGEVDEIDATLNQIFQVLSEDGELDRLRPVSPRNTHRPILSPNWRIEARVQSRGLGFISLLKAHIRTVVESFLGYIFIRFNIKNPILGDPLYYQARMLQQSDWIKMDGCLRLVLDATPDEEKKIIDLLDRLSFENKVIYGFYTSSSTVMTCHFQSGITDQHTHFIDGFGGGLTQAATDLKSKARNRGLFKNRLSVV